MWIATKSKEKTETESGITTSVCRLSNTRKKLLHSNKIMKPFKTGFERPHNNQINIIDKKWKLA